MANRASARQMVVLLLLCLAGFTGECLAQPPVVPAGVSVNPLDRKEVARARFEATRSPQRSLNQARVEAARVVVMVVAENYQAGRRGGTLDGFLEAAYQLLEVERALRGPGADPTPFAEKYWELAWASEALSLARYEAGSENIAEVAAARHDRLQAEINWARARRHGGKAGEPVEKFPDLLFEEITPKDLAQAKFEATQSDIPALQQDKLQAARVRLLVRVENYRAGRRGGTLDALLEAARWVLQAERDLLGPGADPTPFLEKHWELAWTTEALSRGRYEAGSDNIGDLMQARLARLEAELLLLQAHARQKK
jgi:hypothetical protein